MKKIEVSDLDLFYGGFQALKSVTMAIEANKITAMIGPSGCGKSTLLRVFNRMNDSIEGIRITGSVRLDGIGINGYKDDEEIDLLRRKVGMVFQRPNPFPLSVFENVAFGLKIHKIASGKKLHDIVEDSLKAVLLWDGLKDRLKKTALDLTLEQQQRLCIARLLAVKPDVILLDEPCSSLDPIATQKIEELMLELKKRYTIIIVTHNMAQAARVSDDAGFMLLGRLVEFGETSRIFTAPAMKETEDYITGRYG
ncbi:MAG: phosphate ABC transporter ATP-binding protein [Spirochaetaceae bacterium]|nr:MAG: phosphate ABC transporter ATP-binding protein [Spirochaetaceae bacterium]